MVQVSHNRGCPIINASFPPSSLSLYTSLTLYFFPVLALTALKTPQSLSPQRVNLSSSVLPQFPFTFKKQSAFSDFTNHDLHSYPAIPVGSVPSFNEIVPGDSTALKHEQNSNSRFSLAHKTKEPSFFEDTSALSSITQPLSSPSNKLKTPISAYDHFSQQTSRLPRTKSPLFEDQPFIVTWNIPDLVCKRHNIVLDTSPFRGVATPAKVPGQFLSLFYTDRLGLYPHVDVNKGQQHNGGIPQRGDLKASMKKAQADISYYIPSKKTKGLAVIDWESWRPLWERNWGTKKIYQTLSLAHVLKTNHYLTQRQATEKAKHQFQVAAKSWMSEMLAMGKAMRPNYLWGFYLFPNCYNYNWHDSQFTGTCSDEVRRQNDKLQWLWDSSTALFPSVYLQSSLADSPKAALMVRGRVREALRVSAPSRNGPAAPVFAYTRPVYVDQSRRFLSQGDLVQTIGEAASVGASGAVLWGASADYSDQVTEHQANPPWRDTTCDVSCRALSAYLKSTLNPYITNVTTAAQMCSLFLCRGNGRCVRKDYNSQLHLHLNPDSFRILRLQKGYIALGKPTLSDLKALSRGFTCQCYEGLNCTPRNCKEMAKALMFHLKPHNKSYTLKENIMAERLSSAKGSLKKQLEV